MSNGKLCARCSQEIIEELRGRTPIWKRHEESDNAVLFEPDLDEHFVRTLLNSKIGAKSSLVKVVLTPIAREELETKLSSLGRGRKFPAEAAEAKDALRKGRDTLMVTPYTAKFIRDELEHSLDILEDPSFRDNPSIQYHKIGIENALKNIRKLGKLAASSEPGPASIVLRQALVTRERLLNGKALDLHEVWSIVDAAGRVLKARQDKCPKSGCVIKIDGSWRVMSNKTGKLWPQTYDSKERAADAIAAYHLRKKGVLPKS